MNTFAKLVSALGNPLAIAFFFGMYSFFSGNLPESQKYFPILFILAAALPIVIYVLINVRNKKFENYDVSNQEKRKGLYKCLIFVFTVLSILFCIFDLDIKGKLLVFASLFHIILCFLINQKIKVSLHTGFTLIFAFIFCPLNTTIALGLFLFSFLNAWSRLYLSRHSIIEVLLGFFSGNLTGIIYLFFFYIYD